MTIEQERDSIIRRMHSKRHPLLTKKFVHGLDDLESETLRDIEAQIDALEMVDMIPTFEYYRQQMEELEAVRQEMRAVACDMGLDPDEYFPETEVE